MSYALKLPHSTDIFKPVFRKTKNSNFVCPHCSQKDINLKSNARAASNFNVLKHILKRRQMVKGKKLIDKVDDQTNRVKYSSDLMNITNNKSVNTKLKVFQIRASDFKAFAEHPSMTFHAARKGNKYFYDSTKSYDPVLLNPESSTDCTIYSYLNEESQKGRDNESGVPFKPKKKKFKSNTQEKSFETVEKVEFSNLDSKSEEIVKSSTVPQENFYNFSNALTDTNNLNEVSAKSSKPDSECIENRNSSVEMEEKLVLPNILENFMGNIEVPKAHHIDPLSKPYSFIVLFQSYIDVTVSNDKHYNIIEFMEKIRKKKFWLEVIQKPNVIEVYNQLLHSFNDDWKIICQLREWMIADKVNFNHYTFAYLLSAYGNIYKENILLKNEWQKEVLNLLQDLRAKKYTVKGLFINTSLNGKEKQNIFCAIKAVFPRFERPSMKIKLNSDCFLLKDLYGSPTTLNAPIKDVKLRKNIHRLIDEQLERELNFSIEVNAIKNKAILVGTPEEKIKFEKMKTEWKISVQKGLAHSLQLAELEMKNSSCMFHIAHYIKSLPFDDVINLMMQAIDNLVQYSGGYSPNTLHLYRYIGNQFYYRYQILKKKNTGTFENVQQMFKKYADWYMNPGGPAKNSRQKWQMILQEYSNYFPIEEREIKWPDEIKLKIGGFLYDIITKQCTISLHASKQSCVPVFYFISNRKLNSQTIELKCHPVVNKLFRKCGCDTISFDTVELPMICPPKPWKSVNQGALLISPTDFIRSPKDFYSKKLDLKQIKTRQLYATFDSLNAIQKTPWMINKPVLDVACQVFEDGGSKELDVPMFPSDDLTPTVYNANNSQMSEQTYRRLLVQEKQNQYGLWCEALYRLSVAKHFSDRIFWLPQNFDFRGRVYPISPYLNHTGGDLYRSLLIFASGQPLGPNGLNWLKIHAINLTGTHKKQSADERLRYANHIISDILDSAEQPLTGKRWWTKSDEPWQTLAACMEIKKALECWNVEDYVCKFPIHQDGSCNGLQHYAALGRDNEGARNVNLIPSDTPQDVYSVVSQIIENKRAADAEAGNKLAGLLEGFVKRKVVKQTIMTTVYGVTHYGAKQQIAKQLTAIENFPKDIIWDAATYLTEKTFESLREMFFSAKQIQDWFIRCASVISSRGECVEWISPIGLPVLQPYLKVVSGGGQRKVIPNTVKQRNAFAPNFIHSLDSTHMMLTALNCEKANVTFAAIHDCFWTHPCNVDIMNRVCREQFISLHSQHILQNLSNFFIENYIKDKSADEEALKVFQSIPRTGDFDINSVIDSVYFFS